MTRRNLPSHKKGFALVVTLSLMILLTVVAVGLLSLASVSLRTASQQDSMSTARANAKMALLLAIGELQGSLGGDRAITANSEILEERPGKPNTMGVWESWDMNLESGAANYDSEKESRFRRWLVSHRDPGAPELMEFGNSQWAGDTIELVGNGSLGRSAGPEEKARAGRVPVSKDGKSMGAYAWHVSDESVKARINQYRRPVENSDALWLKRAGLTGHRPDPSVISVSKGGNLDFLPTDLDARDFEKAEATVGKIVDLGQAELLDGAGDRVGAFRNHVTPYSLGVLADVRRGGLKQDLTSLFELSDSSRSIKLPGDFSGKRLYESTHGSTGVSDPYWSALAGYYNIFKGISDADRSPEYNDVPPRGTDLTQLDAPKDYFPGPVIAKVETLFNFVVRDSHSNWVNTLKNKDPKLKYMGHLVYTPLVTLHNPYNIKISFDALQVSIRNVPVAFNFYVNGRAQASRLVPLTDMFVFGGDRREKAFVLKIADWASPTGGRTRGPIVMNPGQTLVCGPYLDPGASFSNTKGTNFFDWQNNRTGTDKLPMNAKPGFSGRCVGFDVDWINPNHDGLDSGRSTDNVAGVLGLRATDRVHVEFAVQQPSAGLNTAFDVSAQIVSRRRNYQYGGMSFEYQSNDTLKELFPEVHRYPKSGVVQVANTYVPNTDPVSQHARAKSIGIFSAYARTSNGGVYETGKREPANGAYNVLRDGRLAGKPFLFHNPARSVVSVDLASEAAGSHSHELNFQPLPGNVDDVFELDDTNRTSYLTGNTTFSGIKSGSYLELPTGPMQTIADFRRSNALTSSYLPNFTQPVGNSYVSPLMSTDKVIENNPGAASYSLLDHSVLANHALYDRFYFSTIASVAGESPGEVFGDFVENGRRLPTQLFEPYLPAGVTAEDAKNELFSGDSPTDETWQRAAEFQMVRGPFNVNSTSVEAWKAVLASMKQSEIATLWAKDGSLDSSPSDGIPLPGMTLLNGGRIGGSVDAGKIDNGRTNEWNGYREISEADLNALAENIVEQVRERGPFLSLSEFVNRRIGQNSELTRMGALEAAIEQSGLNDDIYTSQIPITTQDVADTNIYPFETPEASAGNPAAGAPGWISQGELMRVIEPSATVRADTFVVRVCGEAWDAAGKVSARAFAEAVVQRVPDYVDGADRPSVNVYEDGSAAEANRRFGRRLSIVSFRWLSDKEI